jgi:hypothetical protein
MTTEQADRMIELLEQIERRLFHIELKLHQGIPPSSQIEEARQRIARDPSQKIAAIKWLREQTGMSLAEAKGAIEGPNV